MKSLQTLIIILVATLFFTACTKNETPETFDSISGVLTAGENVTSDDLIGLSVFLCQFKNDEDISNANLDASTFDIIDMIMLDEKGEFEFVNMSHGNYFIGLNGFIFPTDSIWRFRFDGTEALNIKQTIDRNPADNWTGIFMPCTNYWACIDMKNYSGPELTFIRLYGSNSDVESMTNDYTVETIDGAIQCMPITAGVEYVDGVINIAFGFSTSSQCINRERNDPTDFILGFADGKGETLYSENIHLKRFSGDGNCEGLPQTVGQTTISFIPGTGYVLTNI